ncbi:MAG: ribosomal-processing cysteine protease Prp [Clostridia bacterium]|nr:ribosomal-processing cysteine protease Prp [Clostridia bacterium]
MITAEFYTASGMLNGFAVSGHSGYSGSGSDIVCAAVSSAVYMAANTLTDVMGIAADADVNDDGFLSLRLQGAPAEAQSVLKGLKLHLEGLAREYPKHIKVT